MSSVDVSQQLPAQVGNGLLARSFNRIISLPPLVLGLCCLALVIITHLPSAMVHFATDDYLHKAVLKGEAGLSQLGFSHTAVDQDWLSRVSNAFHFFNHQQGTTQAQQAYGNLPWWSNPQGTMQPFRPLAAFTHWLDYHWWPDNLVRMQWHSLLYFYLFVMGSYVLFRRLVAQQWVALLATGLLIFDVSLSQNLGWMAARNSYLSCGLGMFALWFHLRARDSGCVLSGFLAPFSYGLSLLAAEAGIATAAYLGAYALVMDRRGWWRGSLALWPYVVITLAWRYYYNLHGYGASGLGLYVDPGRDLGVFLGQLLDVFPVICVQLALGRDSLVSWVDLPYRDVLRVLAWLLVLMLVWLIRALLKTDRSARFMFVGSMLAVVPHASLLSAGSRSGVFVAIGFFYVLALWIQHLLMHKTSKPKRAAATVVVGWHLVIPVLLTLIFSWDLIKLSPPRDSLSDEVQAHLVKHPDTSVVIVNHHAPSSIFYLPYEWAAENAALPKRVQVLAPALTGIEVSRIAANSLELHSPTGLVLHQDAPMSPPDQPGPPISKYYIYRLVSGLVTTPEQTYREGMTLQRAGMQIRILSVLDDVVTRVRIDFIDGEKLENKLWITYDWATRRYRSVAPLGLEQRISLPGPLPSMP